MGEIQSSSNQCSYLKNMTYVESNSDGYFGSVDIYRMNDSPFEYLMALRKYFIDRPQQSQNYIKKMNSLRQLDHKNLSKIYHSEQNQEISLCIKTKGVYTFYGYYNYTLEQVIQRKKLYSDIFGEEQLLYVFDCLLDFGLYLKSFNISLGCYSCRSIFLSPEGHIKLYLTEFDEENRHSCFTKAIEDKRRIQEFIFAPEQLFLINQMKAEITYNVYKADIFAMGMVILELLTFDDKMSLKMDRIAFNLANNSSNYSDSFVKLIKGCLHPNPANRLSMEMAYQQVKKIRRQSKVMVYSLKCIQNRLPRKSQTLKKQATKPFKTQFILNGLQKKLKHFQPQDVVFHGQSMSISGRRRVVTQCQ